MPPFKSFYAAFLLIITSRFRAYSIWKESPMIGIFGMEKRLKKSWKITKFKSIDSMDFGLVLLP